MPSVNVPQAGTEGWDEAPEPTPSVLGQRDNNKLTPHFHASEFRCHDGSYCPTVARPAMVKLCRVFLEPMRAKFGVCYVLSGYRHELYNARIGGATPLAAHLRRQLRERRRRPQVPAGDAGAVGRLR